MPKISAIIHTHNDAQRIGRALGSLRPCDEVLVIDHSSSDETGKIARDWKHHCTNGKRETKTKIKKKRQQIPAIEMSRVPQLTTSPYARNMAEAGEGDPRRAAW